MTWPEAFVWAVGLCAFAWLFKGFEITFYPPKDYDSDKKKSDAA